MVDMKLTRRKALSLAAFACACPAILQTAWAQAYPTRPVRIMVGFAPGRKAHHDAHRPRRIGLRPRGLQDRRACASKCGERQRFATGKLHVNHQLRPELPTGGADHCETKVYSPIGRHRGIQLLLYKEPTEGRRLEGRPRVRP